MENIETRTAAERIADAQARIAVATAETARLNARIAELEADNADRRAQTGAAETGDIYDQAEAALDAYLAEHPEAAAECHDRKRRIADARLQTGEAKAMAQALTLASRRREFAELAARFTHVAVISGAKPEAFAEMFREMADALKPESWAEMLRVLRSMEAQLALVMKLKAMQEVH